MKKAKILIHNEWAGVLTEDENGYHFQYNSEYLKMKDAEAISLTLPLSEKKYESNVLFPFFDGLIPEGVFITEGAGRSVSYQLVL